MASKSTEVLCYVKKAFANLLKRNHGDLKILLTGKTGQGKSSLINGILGDKVAVEGASASRCTIEVKMFSKTVHGVPVKVFDSPGLQDNTENEEEYIQGMKEKCGESSLVLYCTKMINTRLADDDKRAMVKLTEAFGEKFWEYAVFVLTFANMENCERKDDRDEDIPEPARNDDEGWKKLVKQRFEGRLKIWEEGLKQFLITEVGVNPDIANKIPVVPTGDYNPTRTNPNPYNLPDCDDWFNKFWEVCCLRVKETHLFLEINKDRMVTEDGVEDNNDDDDEEAVPEKKDQMVADAGIQGDDDRAGDKQNKDNQDLPMSKENEEKIKEKPESRFQQARKSFMKLEKQQTNNPLPIAPPRKKLTQEFSESKLCIEPQQRSASISIPSHREKTLEDYGIPKGNIDKIKNRLSIPSDTLTSTITKSKSLPRLTSSTSSSKLQQRKPTQGAESIQSVESRPIYITDAFAKEMVVESVRKGYGDSEADTCKAGFAKIAKPAKWFIRNFKNK